MNIGLVTSTVIGGILLLSILTLNVRVSQESDSTVMNQMTKGNVNAVADYVEYDYRKVGYKAADPEILKADSNEFSFNADVDDDGTVDQITWRLTTNEVTSTKNPDDKILKRIKNGTSTDIKLGVTNFKLTYFKGDNSQTTTPSEVKSIKVFLEIQSSAPVDGKYVTSSWQKRFFPWNLQD